MDLSRFVRGLAARLGRQDKSASPLERQTKDMAGVPVCRSVGTRAGPGEFMNEFKLVSGIQVRFCTIFAKLSWYWPIVRALR